MATKVKLLCILVCVGTLVVLVALGILHIGNRFPDSGLGFALFKSRYNDSEDQSQILTNLYEQLDGAFTPRRIDDFLTSRFKSTNVGPERTAIVDFYVGQQRRGRPSSNFPSLGEQFVQEVFHRLPQLDEQDQLAALAMIEGCRRRDSIGKYYFTPIGFAVEQGTLPLPQLIDAYREWWTSDTTWEEKCKRSPISDLRFDWFEI